MPAFVKTGNEHGEIECGFRWLSRRYSQAIEFAPLVFKRLAGKCPSPSKKPSVNELGLSRGVFSASKLCQESTFRVGRQQTVRRPSRVKAAFPLKACIGCESGIGVVRFALNSSDAQESFRSGGRLVRQGSERGNGAIKLLFAKFQRVGGIEEVRRHRSRNGSAGDEDQRHLRVRANGVASDHDQGRVSR